MLRLFKNDGTEDVYKGDFSRKARKTCPEKLWGKAQRRMDAVIEQSSLHELGNFPGFNLKKLSGDRDGHYRIEINDQYRICFVWTPQGARCIEIVDYHP